MSLSDTPGKSKLVSAATDQTRRQLLAAEAATVLLTGLLGFLAFRRIVYPIRPSSDP